VNYEKLGELVYYLYIKDPKKPEEEQMSEEQRLYQMRGLLWDERDELSAKGIIRWFMSRKVRVRVREIDREIRTIEDRLIKILKRGS
jgi:hypothetical protein